MEPPYASTPLLPLTSAPVIFSHFNLSVCAPPVILKCLFPLAANSVVYVLSFPATARSPLRLTSSVILQSAVRSNAPLVDVQFHSAAFTACANKKVKANKVTRTIL